MKNYFIIYSIFRLHELYNANVYYASDFSKYPFNQRIICM
ncbi:hypothetical protein COPEUT_02829 [Coprococcus eutactus ATCC 27759]|nr:hypothetical protein COPEUT_02829 [Coprococcus eutactus ATCC 27759]